MNEYGAVKFNTCIAVVCCLFGLVNSSKATEMCQVKQKIVISTFGVDGRIHTRTSNSVAEMFGTKNQSDPFASYATQLSDTLASSSKNYLCSKTHPKKETTINLHLIKLQMAMSDQALKAFHKIRPNYKSYGSVNIDKTSMDITATFVWNPRQMLRDQIMVSQGEVIEDNDNLPFDENHYVSAIENYSNEVLLASSAQQQKDNQEKLHSTLPIDLFTLLRTAAQSTRGLFYDFVHANAQKLIAASVKGYTAISKLIITQAFEKNDFSTFLNVIETQRPDIQALYTNE